MRAQYRFRTLPELAFVEKPIEVASEGRVTIRREAVDSPWLLLEFDSEVTNDHELPQVAAPLILTLSLVAFEHGVAIYDDDASLQPRVKLLRGGVLQDATCRATATVSPLPPHGLLLALAAVPRCCSLPHQDKISLELYHAAATTVSAVAQCVLFTAVVERLAKGRYPWEKVTSDACRYLLEDYGFDENVRKEWSTFYKMRSRVVHGDVSRFDSTRRVNDRETVDIASEARRFARKFLERVLAEDRRHPPPELRRRPTKTRKRRSVSKARPRTSAES